MKAKDAACRMEAVGTNMLETTRHDKQAEIFLDCAWEEFKRVVDLRFGKNKKGVSVQSVLSLRKEFMAWGMAVSAKGMFPWLRPSAGHIAFDIFFDACAKSSGEDITIDRLMKPEFSSDKLRQGL